MKIISAISKGMVFVATGLLLPMMLLTVVNVFLRFIFNSPITGVPELTELMLVCLVLGVAWCGIQGRHIAADMLVARLRPRGRAIAGSITLLASLVIYVIFAWRIFMNAIWVILKDRYIASVMLPVPLFPFHLVLALSIALLCLVLVLLLIQKVKEVAKG